jgi:hypothetical protein
MANGLANAGRLTLIKLIFSSTACPTFYNAFSTTDIFTHTSIWSNTWFAIWKFLHDHLIVQHNTTYAATIEDLLVKDQKE